MGKVIVLGASYGALGVLRALWNKGIEVLLMYVDPNDHASHSRFVSQRVKITNPLEDSRELLKVLMESSAGWDGAMLIPTMDEFVVFLSQNHDELKKKYVFTVRDWTITERIINKNCLYPQAQAVGVLTPKIFFPSSVQSLYEFRSEIPYPCIIKPSETEKFDRVYKKKVLVINDFNELVEKFTDTQNYQLEVMISEIIPGPDSSIFSYRSYIDSHGKVLAELCTQKIRQYPPGYGQGAVHRTIPMIEEIRQSAVRLLMSFPYQGESSTEFKLDYRDNGYKLMEINSRPTTNTSLMVKAGMNFPYLSYLDLVEGARKPSFSYPSEVYWIHNFWEPLNFIKSLRAGTLNFTEFFKPYMKTKVYAVPFFDDPRHFLYEAFLAGKKAMRRAGNLSD